VVRQLAARRHRGRVSRVLRGHQGAAYDARRRRDSIPERRIASVARSVCLRPVRWYRGVPSPVKHPEKVDMVIFRENTEDIYAGIEYAAGTPEAQKVLDFLQKEFPKEFQKDRFGTSGASQEWQAQLEGIGAPKRDVKLEVGVGLKPISRLGTERLV